MTVTADGVKRTDDGKMFVTVAGADGSSTPAGAPGFATVLAQSFVAVSGAADTNENALATITVPAGAMGANGVLRIYTLWSYTNSANNKQIRIRFSGASGTQFHASTQTTSASAQFITYIGNRNATNSQVGAANNYFGSGTSTTAPQTASVDTTAATTVVITGQKASAGETLTLDAYTVELIKP